MAKTTPMARTAGKSGRIWELDALRGATLISMAAYHGMWDLVYLFGLRADWYSETPGYLWQQSICWCFILLSGFCWGLGRRPVKRADGLRRRSAGDSCHPAGHAGRTGGFRGPDADRFWAMLLMIPLHTLFRKIPARMAPIGVTRSRLSPLFPHPECRPRQLRL